MTKTTRVKSKRQQGTTLMELVVVVVSIALITAMAVGGLSKSNEDNKLNLAYTDQSVFAADFESILQEVGVLSIPSSKEETQAITDAREQKVKNYLLDIQTKYLHSYLDFETLKVEKNKFTIYTKDTVDPWGQKYWIVYSICKVKDKDGVEKDVNPGDTMIISGGPNMEIEESGYKIFEFSDDKILLIDVKESTFE